MKRFDFTGLRAPERRAQNATECGVYVSLKIGVPCVRIPLCIYPCLGGARDSIAGFSGL